MYEKGDMPISLDWFRFRDFLCYQYTMYGRRARTSCCRRLLAALYCAHKHVLVGNLAMTHLGLGYESSNDSMAALDPSF